MNKPNITSGEWQSFTYSIGGVHSGDKTICESPRGIVSEKDNANMQAISAVHDLIDSLISVLRIISYDPNDKRYSIEEYYKIIDNAHKALKKAGCK